jgi:hypothetical protein
MIFQKRKKYLGSKKLNLYLICFLFDNKAKQNIAKIDQIIEFILLK